LASDVSGKSGEFRFVFNIKGYRLITRHRTPIVSMGKELREALGSVSKKTVYDKDVPEQVATELWRRFRAVLEILRTAGKLGVVHVQFAPCDAFHPETFDYLEGASPPIASGQADRPPVG
jgi:uncharacterized protein YecE (DUF72 family)